MEELMKYPPTRDTLDLLWNSKFGPISRLMTPAHGAIGRQFEAYLNQIEEREAPLLDRELETAKQQGPEFLLAATRKYFTALMHRDKIYMLRDINDKKKLPCQRLSKDLQVKMRQRLMSSGNNTIMASTAAPESDSAFAKDVIPLFEAHEQVATIM